MLFTSLGQGYIFLLLLCGGAGCALFFCLTQIFFAKIQRKIKSNKNRQKIPKKSQKIQNNTNLDKKNSPRQITFLPAQNTPTPAPKNSTKNRKKIPKNTIKAVFSVIYGAFVALVCGAVVVAMVFYFDYGAFRFYHFLAFLLGFWLIKTIFAKLEKFQKNYANI